MNGRDDRPELTPGGQAFAAMARSFFAQLDAAVEAEEAAEDSNDTEGEVPA